MPAVQDALIILLCSTLLWFAIEETELCTHFFAWVAANPEYEIDSLILPFILSSFGITIYAVRRYREARLAIRERKTAEMRATEMAYHDPLTGLPNRRALIDTLDKHMGEGEGTSAPFDLMFIDLDRFKGINDVYGHLAGDQVLRIVADRLRDTLDKGEKIYRMGGDEFAVVQCHKACEVHDVEKLARRIIVSLSQPIEDKGILHHIGASVGIAKYPVDAKDRLNLMRRADVALYRAKENGRGCFYAFEKDMDAHLKRRARLEGELRRALEQDRFRPYFQPIVDLFTGETKAYEMLARREREDGENVGPDIFVPIFEEIGCINDLTVKLLRRVCVETKNWDPSRPIAINISPVQLKDPWLAQKILGVLTETNFPAQRLSIEITESALIQEAENVERLIRSFKNQGMTIALDDFGTGYSSVQHLRMLPFDKLKIDRSYVQNITSDPEARKMVFAIINLGANLDLTVVAEGIESAHIAELLQHMGCAEGQGFHFGRPLSANAVEGVDESVAVDDKAAQSIRFG